MSKAAFTVQAFGYYLIVLGITLVIAPNLLLNMFFLPETNEVWIRVVGLLVFNIGIYYIFAAKCEATEFFRISVLTRTLVLVAFVVFSFLGFAKPMLISLGVVDFLGGIWTWRALKNDT